MFAAPSTRRYAREQDIDLGIVSSTSPNERVLLEDVDDYVEGEPPIGLAAEPSLATESTADTTSDASDR